MDGTSKQQYLIVGLGNPGKEYALTRHNLGFLTVEAFAKEQGLIWKADRQFVGYVAKGQVGEIAVHLLLPTTYMNESGQAVRRYVDFYKIGHNQLCVVCDDVDIPFGKLRLRSQGGAGGHNGLKSIQLHLNTQNYARLRMGIGREQQGGLTLAEYVLDAFNAQECAELPAIITTGAMVLKRLVSEELSVVMNTVNQA